VASQFAEVAQPVHVADSREGWAAALRELVLTLYAGRVPPLDTSAVRPEGSILKTFGGLASGPEPLHRLHAFMARLFRGAAGRRLTPTECHDLVCNIGEVVVGGGVRRYAPRTCCACWPLSLCRRRCADLCGRSKCFQDVAGVRAVVLHAVQADTTI
jgi:hypothetical protein